MSDLIFLSCTQLLDDHVPGPAFYEREHAVAHVTTHFDTDERRPHTRNLSR